MLFHMYLTPVTQILIPVTKKQNKNTNKQTLHINQRTKQRTLKPIACTAAPHSHKHVQYTQPQKISTTKQQSNKTNERTTTYIHIIHTYKQKIIHAYIHKKSSGRNSRFCRNPSKLAASYSPTFAVPSAQTGLTSLFGMGRGGTPPP